ncbi:hypothetical protein ACFYT4_23015 [Streptomyces sp. NPDC004609]|uniref:hypothetical protein n=1 Tax=Streptomyces sp. NPDC004609 TaxID=3364704 RepID=UPI0036AF3983
MGDWGWVQVTADTRSPYGFRVAFHARTFGTSRETQVQLQRYLESRAREDEDCARAAESLRNGGLYSVHTPRTSWYVVPGDYLLRRFVVGAGGVTRPVTFRRPSPAAAPCGPRPQSRKTAGRIGELPLSLRRLQGFGARAVLAVGLLLTLTGVLAVLDQGSVQELRWAVVAGPVLLALGFLTTRRLRVRASGPLTRNRGSR